MLRDKTGRVLALVTFVWVIFLCVSLGVAIVTLFG